MNLINLNRKDLSKEIYLKLGFSKVITDNLVDDIIALFFKNIIENDIIKIAKFGNFVKKSKGKRIGRNPKTKEVKFISQRKVIVFKPSLFFKKKINTIDNEKGKSSL